MATHARNGGGRRDRRWRVAVWGGAAMLLLSPLVAMQFSDEVDWRAGDFIAMAAMLAVACGTWELGMRTMRNRAYRAGIAIAVAGAFLMTWANLAVGIIGNESNPLNLLFFGVLAVGIVGACLARMRAAGMSRALVAMAVAQVLVAAIVFLVAAVATPVVTMAFTAVWLASAMLFRDAARNGYARQG